MWYTWNKNNVICQLHLNKKQNNKPKKNKNQPEKTSVDFLSFLLEYTPLDKNFPTNLFDISPSLPWDSCKAAMGPFL